MAEGFTSMLGDVTTFITSAVGWMEEFITPILNTPILFTFVVAVPLVGLGIGLLNRLIRAN